MNSKKIVFFGMIAVAAVMNLMAGDSSRTAKKTLADPGKPGRPGVSFAAMPLSFEPNVGQSEASAKFIAHGAGYSVQLEPGSARIGFGCSASVTMDLVNAKRDARLNGENRLSGTANYFPTSDRKTWHANIPTYSKVRATGVYPGIDVDYYGNASKLEYDFLVQPGADPGQIRMRLGGAEWVNLDASGDLVLHFAKGDFRLLRPVAYQTAAVGRGRDGVKAGYRLKQTVSGEPALVTLALGTYDRSRPLVIDPEISGEGLIYSEYLTQGYVAGVAVDNSGNTYVTGTNYPYANGFYVTEVNSSGAVVYTTNIGAVDWIFPYGIAVDGSGRAYAVGQTYSGATLPTSTNSYKKTTTASSYNAFYVQIANGGGSVPYATFLGGTDTNNSNANAVAVDSSGNSYIAGQTSSPTFPVTTGVYQNALQGGAGNNNGFVAKINPAASGSASLVYSTFLGPASTNLTAVAIDGSGDVYVTGNAPHGFPVTSGAFQYTGYYSGSGGVYATELNPTATALVYSAYLGYGTGCGIAVDGSGDAYVTGTVGYDDFPTTVGAYQTSYAGGFATELSAGGATEVYSTFLGGPSSFNGSNVVPEAIAIPSGCSSSCNAYISGWTSTTDFPTINAFQTSASSSGQSGFIVELAGGGGSAVFSSYLSGLSGGVTQGGPASGYSETPSLALDSLGNISVVGNLTGTADFPITVAYTTATSAFLAKIGPSSAPYIWGVPSTIAFGSQPVGVSTSISSGTQTVVLRNISSTGVTLQSILASPPSIFSESDNCNGAIAAGGSCTLNIDFTPGGPGSRTGQVTVTSSASDSPTVIALSGTGYDTAYIQASPSSLSFPNQNLGSSGSPQSVTLTNIGDESASMSVSVQYGADYSQLNNCPSQLAAGSSCLVNVTFTPTQAGLRSDTLYVNGGTTTVPLSGAGTISGANSQLSLSATTLDFGNEPVASTTSGQYVYITNNGSVPVAIQSITAAGDFSVNSTSCGSLPTQLTPQNYCYAYVTFTPSATGTRTGTLTITDSDPGSPYAVALTGNGLASVQTLEFYPATTVVFPDQPVGYVSGTQIVYAYNVGTAPLTIDRVLVSGDYQINYTYCPESTLPGTLTNGTGNASYSYCYVYVTFTPTTTGARAGALTFTDSSPGSPHVVNLSGNGITATGTVVLTPSQLVYPAQAKGTTSPVQFDYIENPGNTPVTVTSMGTGASDFAINYSNCGTTPTLQPGETNCYVELDFTPTVSSAPPGTTRTGTFTVNSSAGSSTVSLTGIGVTTALAAGVTPTSLNFGSVIVGQTSFSQPGYYFLYLRNTGTAAVTLTDLGAITGTNASEFSVTNYSCPGVGGQLQPGASCPVYANFAPTASGAASATLTFHTSAGALAVPLSGTGVTKLPNSTASTTEAAFDLQVLGTASAPTQYYPIYFYNNGSSAVAMGNVGLTGDFMVPTGGYDTCSGQAISGGGQCHVYLSFAPTVAGYRTGTLTFKNSVNATLVSVPLAGYAPAAVLSAYIDPTAVTFPENQVVGTIDSNSQTITLYNTGNLPLTVGTVNGTNLGASPTNEFSITSNGGTDNCSGKTVAAGNSCYVYIYFTPNATGSRTGTIVFPVTYTGGTTASFTATVAGTGVPEKNSAVVSPAAGTFLDTAVGITTTYSDTFTLTNSGNMPFTVGTLAGTNIIVGASNSGEFSASATTGGYDNCSGVTVPAGSSCSIAVTFTPSATGARNGSVSFPVTFADTTTASPTATLTATGVTVKQTVQIAPAGIQFPVQIQGTTSGVQALTVTNTGNVPIHVGTDSISGDFKVSYDNCGATNLGISGSCSIGLTYKPTTTGPETGTFTIADNATGGPHSVALSGTGILASQQVAVSQTSLTFGNQPSGSTSAPQAITVTNQGDTNVTSFHATLGGTNPTAFQITNSCPTALGARSTCTMTVAFSPASNASGPLSASIAVTTSVSGETSIPIGLTGTAVPPGPYASLQPASLTFAQQNVGTTSAAQKISVTNTGSANLTISGVVSTNASEFPTSADACSGATLTPGQVCTVSVKFKPSIGGTRSTTINVTDNAPSSPQALAVTGTGYGIPQATLNPTSLTYTSQNIGSTSASQNVVLSNPGTDTLNIAGIALTGVHAGDYAISNNTCGATLAPTATCTISATFTPTASGSRGASVTVTDNAGNLANSTQSASLTGTGVAVPTATGLAPSLTFATQNVGTTSAAQTATLTNSGSGPLSIASIVLGGSNPGDFAQVNNCGQTLNAGANCTISVTFTPTASGARGALITVTDNANNAAGSTQTITLSGTGQGVPGGSVLFTNLSFGNQNVGTPSAAQTVTFNNGGTSALAISSVAIGGTNASDFSQTNTCGSSLAAGASCNINVTFKPTTVGNRSATLTITDNANNVSGSTQTVGLSGTGVEPLASPSPTSLPFGNQNLNVASAPLTVKLSNTGNAALGIESITIGGTNPSEFTQTNNCGTSVAAAGSCTITVTFTPTALGSQTATLTIADNSANNFSAKQNVTLTGTGVQAPAAGVSPSTVPFGNQFVNVSSASQPVTLSNTGEASLTITNIAFSGTNATDFTQTNNCAGSVAVNSSCTISVTFTPKATGSRSGTLVITDNNNNVSGSTQSVTLTGTGTAPKAAAAPTTLTFTSQSVGTSSASKPVTLTNSGTAPLTITAIAFGGTDPGDYSETDNCAGGTFPATLNNGSSCTINVTFTPTYNGSRPATLVITDNSNGVAGSTQSVTIAGTGAAPEATITPSSLIVTFANQTVGTTSSAQTVTLKNSGTGTMTINSVVVGGANPGDFPKTTTCGATLGANASCTVSVKFSPTQTGARTATLTFTDNANNVSGATQSVTLNGTGQ